MLTIKEYLNRAYGKPSLPEVAPVIKRVHPKFTHGGTRSKLPECRYWASVHSTMTRTEVIQWGATELEAKLKCLNLLRSYARKKNALRLKGQGVSTK